MLQRSISITSWIFVTAIMLMTTVFVAPAAYAQSVEDALAKVKEMEEDPARHYNLGLAYYRAKKYTEAITSFQESINRYQAATTKGDEYPDFREQDAYYNMGLSQQQAGKNTAAIKSFKSATDSDPQYAEAFAALGGAYRKNGQHTAAARAYESAIKLDSRKSTWHYNLGIVYQMMEDYENAIVAYEGYLKLSPNAKNAGQIKKLISDMKQYIE